MRILYQSRVDLYDIKGGDTSQVDATKAAIEKLDPNIKIDVRSEVEVEDIEKYDLVHLFNLDWIPETYLQAKWAKKHGKPIVLSAIHHSEQEVLKYESEARYDLRRLFNLIFITQSSKDVAKNVFRSIFDSRKAYPTFVQAKMGIRNQQREIINMVDTVLVQTEEEAKDIEKDFKVKLKNYSKVVNGVDLNLFQNPDKDKFSNLIKDEYDLDMKTSSILLNVGRIEPRKNQLKLIEAFNSIQDHPNLSNYRLVFIGGISKRSPEYKYKFKKAVESNPRILYLGIQPSEIVASAMSQKGIYVHTSWFETTGLVTLEASLAGMNVIASGKRVKEYLNNSAFYIDPSSVESVKNAILEAVINPKDISKLQFEIAEKYTWANTAIQTMDVYKKTLKL